MRTSRSLSNATSAGFGIFFSWVLHRDCALPLGRTSEQRIGRSALCLCSLAPGRFGLEFVEQCIEALVVLFEDPAVTFDPIHGLSQPLRFQFAGAPLRIDAHRDEAGTLEHFQVPGNRGLAHLERLGKFRHGGLPLRQPRQDGAAGGVGQGGEGPIEVS
jgi:hypothetical protein